MLPPLPPTYTERPIEQFELEPPPPVPRLRRSIQTLQTRVLNVTDPLLEGYQYAAEQYERSILKLGNPLVVKRLFYMFFVAVVLFFISRNSSSDGVDGSTGGGFSQGKLYNMDRLMDSAKSFVDSASMKSNLEYFSSMPHVAGSHGDLTLAKYIQQYMHNNGLKVIDFNEVKAFVNYPTKKSYVKTDNFEATLHEGDGSSMDTWAYNPNSLNTNGEVKARYFYANYGEKKDYERLPDVSGAILLIKYGGALPEPNKVALAHEYGAKAVIFISKKVTVLDSNGQRVERDDAIQRINVGYTRMGPGDILTPGWSNDGEYVTKQPWFKSALTPKLPTIPISYRDAKKLLQFSDGVDFGDFYSGTGQKELRLVVANDERMSQQLWNVVGSIEGREQPETGIIIGASRDSAAGPGGASNTGSVLLLELVRVLTSLQRQYNWSPSRTIYFVSFDGTAYNLAGSAEWIKSRRDVLQKEGYAYIDLADVVAGDTLSVKAHPLLHDVIKDCLKRTKDDGDMYGEFVSANGNDIISNNMLAEANYLPFINMVNVPSIEIKYGEGTQHTCYDTFASVEQIDPSMRKHASLASMFSSLVLSLAESPVIPYNFNDLTALLTKYSRDLERHAHDLGGSLDVAPINKAIDFLQGSASRFHMWHGSWRQFLAESGDVEPAALSINRWHWNQNMLVFNEVFAGQETSRPGYVNVLFGVPLDGPQVGGEYEWNTFPRVREKMMGGDWEGANREVVEVANLLVEGGRRFVSSSR